MKIVFDVRPQKTSIRYNTIGTPQNMPNVSQSPKEGDSVVLHWQGILVEITNIQNDEAGDLKGTIDDFPDQLSDHLSVGKIVTFKNENIFTCTSY